MEKNWKKIKKKTEKKTEKKCKDGKCTIEPKVVRKAMKENEDRNSTGSKEGYITLDIKAQRLKVCKELSMHQQPLFTRKGLNPIVKNLLARQEGKK